MRTGTHAAKLDTRLEGYRPHRVVIPVYIPNLEGYFARSLEVLKLCLESLHRTAAGLVSLTVVSNGCAPEVVEECQAWLGSGRIDQLVLNGVNRGKVDSALSQARACFEPLVTITDCDVLFRPGWVQAVEGLFSAYPECGFATPSPNPKLAWYHASGTVLGGLWTGELGHEKQVPDLDLDRFASSVGDPNFFTEEHRRTQVVVRRGGVLACVGGGHFVFSVRREVLSAIPHTPSLKSILGNSEEQWLDAPPDRAGYWRLSTPKSYAYHMGNLPEPWMYDELDSAAVPPSALDFKRDLPPLSLPLTSRLPWSVRLRLTSWYRDRKSWRFKEGQASAAP